DLAQVTRLALKFLPPRREVSRLRPQVVTVHHVEMDDQFPALGAAQAFHHHPRRGHLFGGEIRRGPHVQYGSVLCRGELGRPFEVGEAVGWLCTPESMPSICLLY